MVKLDHFICGISIEKRLRFDIIEVSIAPLEFVNNFIHITQPIIDPIDSPSLRS